MRMPEEINRILTDRVSTWLFAPTDEAVRHLAREGISRDAVVNVGDVMYDVALHHGRRAEVQGRGVLDSLGVRDGQYVLVTVHRAENTDVAERLCAIVRGLSVIATDMDVIWPLHPRTRKMMEAADLTAGLPSRLRLIAPQGYLDMVRLERAAAVIATDSGGVQKEAIFHRVPCVTLRDETEWVELVQAGWNRVVPPLDARAISAAILDAVGTKGFDVQPYGEGNASERIAARLASGPPR